MDKCYGNDWMSFFLRLLPFPEATGGFKLAKATISWPWATHCIMLYALSFPPLEYTMIKTKRLALPTPTWILFTLSAQVLSLLNIKRKERRSSCLPCERRDKDDRTPTYLAQKFRHRSEYEIAPNRAKDQYSAWGEAPLAYKPTQETILIIQGSHNQRIGSSMYGDSKKSGAKWVKNTLEDP